MPNSNLFFCYHISLQKLVCLNVLSFGNLVRQAAKQLSNPLRWNDFDFSFHIDSVRVFFYFCCWQEGEIKINEVENVNFPKCDFKIVFLL